MTAARTLVDMATQRRRAATQDGREHPKLICSQLNQAGFRSRSLSVAARRTSANSMSGRFI
jgi:hypothetical protein